MSEKIIQVAAGVISRGRRYLITKRMPNSHLGGLWEFPGGKRRSGETLQECLRRELKEELGLDVCVERKLGVIQHHYSRYTVRLHFYFCTIRNGTPRALGNQSYRWVHPSGLARFEFPEANQALIRKLVDFRGQGE